MLNKIYDLIILGSGADGEKAARYISKKDPDLHFAVISRAEVLDFIPGENIDVYTDTEIVYINYYKGLIQLITEKNTKTFFCTKLILATGTEPEKYSNLPKNNVFYNSKDLPEDLENILVIGEPENLAKTACGLSKKYKKIFICDKVFEIQGAKKYRELVGKTENVYYLPNCGIKTWKQGAQLEITLTTNEVLTVDGIFVASKRVPDISLTAANSFITRTETNAIETDEAGRLIKVPTIYAYGTCTTNKVSIDKIFKSIKEN